MRAWSVQDRGNAPRPSRITLCGHTGCPLVTPTTTSWAIRSYRPSHKWGAARLEKQWV